MKMLLPSPADQYDKANEAQTRSKIEQADALNQKKGQDVVINKNRLILTDANGVQWAASISTSGVLTWVEL
ncbi:MAG TPA: hypothetical protein VGH23_20510 [Rhizomicrobium sp.]|jgi:hypothetical protein